MIFRLAESYSDFAAEDFLQSSANRQFYYRRYYTVPVEPNRRFPSHGIAKRLGELTGEERKSAHVRRCWTELSFQRGQRLAP